MASGVTTRQSASLAVHGQVKRGPINAAPKAPLLCGREAPAPRPEFFTDIAGDTVSLTVYGEVSMQPDLAVGTYVDTVVATLCY